MNKTKITIIREMIEILPIYFVNKITKNILSVIIITVYNYYKC